MSQSGEHEGALRLRRAVRSGALSTGGAPFSVRAGSEFLAGLHAALASSDELLFDTLYRAGYAWGEGWLERLDRSLSSMSLNRKALELDDLEFMLKDEFASSRWGHLEMDTKSRASVGVVLVTVTGGPVALLPESARGLAMLLGGFMAGVFTGIAGVPMAGLGVPWTEAAAARLLVAHERRVERVWLKLTHGAEWNEALDALE